MSLRPLSFASGFLLVLMTATNAGAQHVYSPPDALSDTNITVHINGANNKPLKQQAFVSLSQRGSSLQLGTVMTTVSSEAVLSGMPGYGWYTIRVTSPGYHDESRDVEYSAASGRIHVDISLQPIATSADAGPAPGDVLSPKAQEQVQKGREEVQAGKLDDAIKDFLAVHNAAPKNAEVCYLLGAAYQKDKNLPQAQKYLELATSIDPGDVPSLVALGQLRDQLKDYKGAIPPLEKAAALDGSEYMARWALADACLRVGEYEKARKNAEEAVEIGKGAANKAELIEGQALAQLGRRDEAVKVFEAFLRDMPNDPAVPAVRGLIQKLQSPAASAPQ
jgi:tetratricopeptide (TPR) repeat protein